RARGHNAQGSEPGPRGPVARIQARPDKSFQERPRETGTAAAAHKDRVGAIVSVTSGHVERGGLFVREDLTPGDKAHRHGDVNMRGAKVRMGLAGIKMFWGRVAELHFDGLVPVEEIIGSGATDRAITLHANAGPSAEVSHITVFGLGPEGDVLRI